MRQILLLPAVGGESLEIADVDFVAADDEVGPGGTSAHLHLVHKLESFRAGFDEKEKSAVIEGKNSFA